MQAIKNIGFPQIIELLGDRILRGIYHEGERIPSVRDLAVELQVAPNTVVRAYERLSDQEIIYTQRGIGYFVAPGALERVRTARRRLFHEETIPQLLSLVNLLGISQEELRRELGL